MKMCHSQVGHDAGVVHSTPHGGSRVPSAPLIYMTQSSSEWICSRESVMFWKCTGSIGTQTWNCQWILIIWEGYYSTHTFKCPWLLFFSPTEGFWFQEVLVRGEPRGRFSPLTGPGNKISLFSVSIPVLHCIIKSSAQSNPSSDNSAEEVTRCFLACILDQKAKN